MRRDQVKFLWVIEVRTYEGPDWGYYGVETDRESARITAWDLRRKGWVSKTRVRKYVPA